MKSSKTNRIFYWAVTLLFALAMTGGGLVELSGAPKALELMNHLGYPLYLLKILGAAKLLGVGAVLVVRFPRLKEWAYAGFTFDLAGAILSHLAIGDVKAAFSPVPPLVLMAVSYIAWKRSALKAEQGANHSVRAISDITTNSTAALKLSS